MPEVLVIDDNPAQLHVREAVLRGAGFTVLCADSAEQGLEFLADRTATNGLRLILTDHVLPGASGAAFVRELRKVNPKVAVFVITGMDEAEQEYEGLGVTFLHKPCSPEDLVAKVRAAVEGQRP
jgi:DNA-binding response OmpR family regulator